MNKQLLVSELCDKEVKWAKEHGFNEIHLILFNESNNQKIFDKMVGLNDKINIDDFINENIIKEDVEKELQDPKYKEYSINLNLSFQTTPPEITDRVASVGEAFGVGVDEEKEFQIFDNLEIRYNQGDLIYITGDSGSGKTTFLKLFKNDLQNKDISCADLSDIDSSPDEVVIDNIGNNKDEAMYYLGVIGLSEAFLMVRRYRELSQGQKYRYILGKLISVNADVYFIDEFGATLDRVMARVLAYGIQKWARRNNKMLVIATTHTDLIDDFNADVLIYKGFGEKTDVSYYKTSRRPISLVRDMEVGPGEKKDYDFLERFHYIKVKKLGFIKGIFKLTHRGKTIGVIVYTSPFLQVRLRNNVMPEYKGKGKADKVNSEIVRIARIIIHPKFRGCGLAQELIRRTMPLTNMRVVETIAAMPKYNPFFEKAGLTKVGIMPFNKHQERIRDTIIKFGGEPSLLHSKIIRKRFLNDLSSEQFEYLMNILMKGIKGIKGQGGRGKNLAKSLLKSLSDGDIDSVLAKQIPVERVYLYWVDPAWSSQN